MTQLPKPLFTLFLTLWIATLAPQAFADDRFSIGVATIDITPEEAIRMSGFGGRKAISNGVAGRLYAKALAIEGKEGPCILLTADLIGIPDWLTRAVSERLQIPMQRLALCATHTHSGPQLRGLLEPIFMERIPAEHRVAIDRYSDSLIGKLVSVCREALEALQPGRLEWGIGEVGFARNRRVLEDGKWTGFGVQEDGPVDHRLPVMRARDERGSTIALLANYACHCVTLGGAHEAIHGDWAGEAQRIIEERHPGAVAMIAIGCGADANPFPMGSLDAAIQHGEEIADEVDRLLENAMIPLEGALKTRMESIQLPLDPLPSRVFWENLAASQDRLSYYAELTLNRLDAGETLPTSIDYGVQTWSFGDELAMVFLPGEVVVDYSLKMQEMFDPDRLWINAYANASPSYIPSRRLYNENGYEVDKSMYYYDKPVRLSPDTEDLVLDAVLKQVSQKFYSDESLRKIPAPISKQDALATFSLHEEMRIDLVAAEPETMDPIDIAWGADGRMWVVEMADYPLGVDGEGSGGGRIRVLEDSDGDGYYETSTLFIESIGYPTSVMPWREGALVTAAPDLVYAEDADGDGRADKIETLFTGFNLGNEQHLVNGLHWGLDGWVYLANGDSGGAPQSILTGDQVDINGRDLRLKPDEGLIETVMGRTQFGRNRDRWGNWFGNSNSWPGWHYRIEAAFLNRNPHANYANARQFLPKVPQAGPVFPTSRTLSRFNDYEKSNRFTSASGFMIYDDEALGEAFVGNGFVAESVHNLVSRSIVEAEGYSFRSRRATEELQSEFLSSTDNWFRPTAIRAGPDGALYVVDMYRFVIEHPEWVPEDWQRKLDLRMGHDKGRIYRISRKGALSREAPRLDELSLSELVTALDSGNRWQRDKIHQRLLWSDAINSIPLLRTLVAEGKRPEARIQALWILYQLKGLDETSLLNGLSDPIAEVRRQAVRVASECVGCLGASLDAIRDLGFDEFPLVRMEVAYVLGEAKDRESGRTLARMALEYGQDPTMRSAILSSASPHLETMVETLSPSIADGSASELFIGLSQTAHGSGNFKALAGLVAAAGQSSPSADRFESLRDTLEVAQRFGRQWPHWRDRADPLLKPSLVKIDQALENARQVAIDRDASESLRVAAMELMPFAREHGPEVAEGLGTVLRTNESWDLKKAAVNALAKSNNAESVAAALEGWARYGPRLRSYLLETFQSRRDTTIRLLDAVEHRPELRTAFSSLQTVSLRRHADRSIRDRANAIFGAQELSDRAELVARFEKELPERGNSLEGQRYFGQLCASCHRVGDIGYDVGPDLASLTDKSVKSMLVAILDPNRAIEDKYAQYAIEYSNGDLFAGIVEEETDTSVRTVGIGGIRQDSLRSNIKSMQGVGTSLMPEGLEEGLSPQAMADLIAFLRESDRSLRIEPEADGSLRLVAQAAVATGESVFYNLEQSAFDRIAAGDRIEWTVHGLAAGAYSIFADASQSTEYEGRPFKLYINDSFVTGAVVPTGGAHRFRHRKFGDVEIESDLEIARIRLEHRLEGAPLSLRELRLIPSD